jgi:hypothetical protein
MNSAPSSTEQDVPASPKLMTRTRSNYHKRRRDVDEAIDQSEMCFDNGVDATTEPMFQRSTKRIRVHIEYMAATFDAVVSQTLRLEVLMKRLVTDQGETVCQLLKARQNAVYYAAMLPFTANYNVPTLCKDLADLQQDHLDAIASRTAQSCQLLDRTRRMNFSSMHNWAIQAVPVSLSSVCKVVAMTENKPGIFVALVVTTQDLNRSSSGNMISGVSRMTLAKLLCEPRADFLLDAFFKWPWFVTVDRILQKFCPEPATSNCDDMDSDLPLPNDVVRPPAERDQHTHPTALAIQEEGSEILHVAVPPTAEDYAHFTLAMKKLSSVL